MTIPFMTTTATVSRWSLTDPGTKTTVATLVPCVVGSVSGREVASYKGSADAGFQEALTGKFVSDQAVAYNDLVADVGTGQEYRVVWAKYRMGLGLDHWEAGLADYKSNSTFACFRGTTTNEWGDQVSNSTAEVSAAEWAGVAGDVREVQRTTMDPVTQVPNTVSIFEGRFPPGMDIRTRDIIKDLTSGTLWTAQSVNAVSNDAASDVGVELVRVQA